MARELVLGNIVMNGNMPMLEIGDSEDKLYIMPFRAYAFQVSSESGSGDYGSSKVVGLGNIVGIKPNLPEDTRGFSPFSSNIREYDKEFLRLLIQDCILSYFAQGGTRKSRRTDDDTSYLLDAASLRTMNNRDKISGFVDSVIVYIKEITKNHYK